MIKQRPVSISKNAFSFCRYSIAIIIVLAFALKVEALVWLVFFLLVLSAILGVKRAPLILFYSNFEKLFKITPKYEIVDINAIRFAHILGSMLSGTCVLLLMNDSRFAWPFVFVFAVLKIISATGFCPATKLYSCSTSGSCCRFIKSK